MHLGGVTYYIFPSPMNSAWSCHFYPLIKNMKKRHFSQFLLLAATSLVLTSCCTFVNSHRQKTPMMNAYIIGNHQEARQRANDKIASTAKTGDELIWRLEAGSLAFNTANYAESLQQFARAQELIDENDQKALVSMSTTGQEALAILTNPNVISYVAYNRDRITIPIYKSLATLGLHGPAAFRAELNLLRHTQNLILEKNHKFVQAQQEQLAAVNRENPAAAQQAQQYNIPAIVNSQQNKDFAQGFAKVTQASNRAYSEVLNPLAIFLAGLGSLRDGNLGNARIDFQRFYEAMPDNPLAQTYFATVGKIALAANQTTRQLPVELAKTPCFNFPLDRNCVYVIVASGRSAALEQLLILWPTQLALPMMQFYTSPFTAFNASAGGQNYPLIPITDMDACLAKEYRDRLPGTILRTATATIAKEIAVRVATDAAHRNGGEYAYLAASMTNLAGTAYKVATATADTRTWEVLPQQFLLTQLPLPQDRQVKLDFQGPVPMQSTVSLPAEARSAIIFVNAPSTPACTIQVLPFNDK